MTINRIFSNRISLSLMLLAGVVFLPACSDKDNKNGQALISVNGSEITVPQLNQELAQNYSQDVANQDQTRQRKKALETLVDRQLLSEKAMQEGLNRDLDMMLNLEKVKSQILADAYMKKHIETVPPPTEAEISAFYKLHPDYFAQRKIFEMKEVSVDTAEYNDKMQEATNGAKSLDEIIAWFEAHKVKNSVTEAIRTSSDLPEQIAEKVNKSDSLQIFVLNTSGKTMFITLLPIKDSPLTLQEASAGISDYLINKKNEEAADALLRRLRSEAKLEMLNLKAVGLDSNKTVLFADDTAKAASPANDEVKAAEKSDIGGLK